MKSRGYGCDGSDLLTGSLGEWDTDEPKRAGMKARATFKSEEKGLGRAGAGLPRSLRYASEPATFHRWECLDGEGEEEHTSAIGFPIWR
jgi:hypothetical protein